MLNKIIISSLLIVTTLTIKAQNSEQRTLNSFTGIEIQSKSKITIHPGSTQIVSVESSDLNEVQTTVENGTLVIKGKSSKIDITLPILNSISIDGNGEMVADSMFKATIFNIQISGNGKIILPVEADQIKADVSGFGKIKLSGSANNLEMNISGNGKIDAQELQVKDASANISGIGKCLVDVSSNLDVNISGNGSVYYKTEPAHVVKQVSGIGRLGNIDTSVNDNDTTTVHVGKKRIIIIGGNEKEDDKNTDVDIDFGDSKTPAKPKKSSSHWMGLDLGFNNYLNSDFNTSLPKKYDFLELNTGKSVAVNLNFYAHDFKIYKRYMMFTTGVGMSINNYRFSSDHTMIPKIDSVAAIPDSMVISLDKSKLTVTYVTIPLLLQFNTSERFKKSIHIGTGVLLSYRIGSHTKQVYTVEGMKKITKQHDDFNLNPFRGEATLRLGYRGVTIFGNYAFTELFNAGDGPELHPFAVGLQLSGW